MNKTSQQDKRCAGCSRREALKLGATGLLIAPLTTSGLMGCGGIEQEPLAEPFMIALSEYPELKREGGVVILPSDVTGHEHGVIVRRLEQNYDAMSAECNHRSCNVELESEEFVCPCHGSRFGIDGTLKEGPATSDLLALRVVEQDGMLTISST